MAHEEAQPTRLLYYEDAYMNEFTAKVLRVQEQNGLSKILLDQTAFYPTGGGQPSDTGKITGRNGDAKISEAHLEHAQIVHFAYGTQARFEDYEQVMGLVDWNRRYALMRNHTLAHVMAEVIRKVVGLPIEVVGSGLDVEKARLDMAYEGSLGPLLQEIERIANITIRDNRPVTIRTMPREQAEEHVLRFHESLKTLPPQISNVRIVEIQDLHACACGGTHVKSVGEIGQAEVLRRMSKGKGVERIEFRSKMT